METKQELQQELARLKELVKKTEEKINNVLEVGKWYKFGSKGLFYYQGKRVTYGINNDGNWSDDLGFANNNGQATHEEVEQALIKEAKKKGFKEGITVSREWTSFNKIVDLENEKYRLFDNETLTLNGWEIFKKGKWEEIISEPNIEVKAGIKFTVDESDKTVYTITSCNDVGIWVGWGGQSNRVDYKKEIVHKYLNDGTWIVVDDNEEPKIGDVCKFWDVDEDIFVIGKLNSIDTESQYKFVIADITNAPYYFINATPLTQQQAIDLLFNS